MNSDPTLIKNDLTYWVTEAKEIMNMIESDEIESALNIAAYLRRFYIKGKEDGHWECNNLPR